jgi:2-methylaconitate cis-trans-isomerase PrpF
MDDLWQENVEVKCSILRGGTSKGVFFRESDMPSDRERLEKVILRIFGSPDLRQIDGLGGANSLTSKVAIVGTSKRDDADVDYTFGQVIINKPQIDWIGNCGNLSAAVGPFAIDEGMVKVEEPFTKVRIFNTNTKKIINARIPVKNGKVLVGGSYSIPGVPIPGARIDLEFVRPDGSVTGKLLPTGKARDSIKLENGRIMTVSIVDAANPVVFLKSEELGLLGTELPTDVEQMPEVLKTIEEVRSKAAERIGLVDSWEKATKLVPAIPKIGFVAPAQNFTNPEGINIKKEDMHFVARLASMQKMHRAYMVTGAICTSVAANIPGTVVNEVASNEYSLETVRIGHPYGVMEVGVRMEGEGDDLRTLSATVGRTARRIMSGWAYVPHNIFY